MTRKWVKDTTNEPIYQARLKSARRKRTKKVGTLLRKANRRGGRGYWGCFWSQTRKRRKEKEKHALGWKEGTFKGGNVKEE